MFILIDSTSLLSHLIVWNTWPSASPSPASPAARSACRPRPHTAGLRSESPGSPAHAQPGPPASPRCPDSSSVSLSLYPGSPAGKPSVASVPAALKRSGWSAHATERSGPVLTEGDIRLVMCEFIVEVWTLTCLYFSNVSNACICFTGTVNAVLESSEKALILCSFRPGKNIISRNTSNNQVQPTRGKYSSCSNVLKQKTKSYQLTLWETMTSDPAVEEKHEKRFSLRGSVKSDATLQSNTDTLV